MFMDWRLNIVRMAILHTLIYRFSDIPIKILAGFFSAIAKLILKFIQNYKRSKSQSLLQSSSNQDSKILA